MEKSLKNAQKTDLSWLCRFPFAHRGLHDNANSIPENSFKAFEAAIANNYAIELDVIVIGGNKVIVFHDDNLKRICGIIKPVKTLDQTDYAVYRLLGTKEQIPLLEDVLSFIDGRVPVLIDIKNYTKSAHQNMVILNALLGYKGHLAIQSFNPFTLKWFSKYAPTIPRGQLASSFGNRKMNPLIKYLLKNVFLNFLAKPDFIACDINALPNRRIEKLHKKGMLLLGWTIENGEEANKCHKYCDNLIFENFSPIDMNQN